MSGDSLLGCSSTSSCERPMGVIGATCHLIRKKMQRRVILPIWRTWWLDASCQIHPQFSCGEHSILVALLCCIDGLVEWDSITSNSKKDICMLPEEHWDTCQAAGPAKRRSTPFEEPAPTLKALSRDGSSLTTLGWFQSFSKLNLNAFKCEAVCKSLSTSF